MQMTVEAWIKFAESGNQQRLVDQHGKVYQGWIMEITDEALLISTGDGERGMDHWLTFEQINPEQLCYFDSKQRQWINFSCTPH